MLEKSNGKIGFRELSALIFVMIGVKAIDLTPANLFSESKNTTWMIPIIWLFVMAIPFLLMLKILKKYKDQNLIEINYKLLGKYLGFIISISLFFAVFSANITNSRGYVDVLSSRYLTETPTIVLYFVVIFSSYFLANRGLETIGRTAFLIVPYSVIAFVILQILVWKDLEVNYLFPILGPGVKQIIITGTQTSSLIGEFLLFAALFPYVKDYKIYKKANILMFIISCLFVSWVLANYIMVFDYIGPTKMLHPFSQLTRHTEIPIFINNLDAIYLLLWILIGIIRFSFYLYGMSATFAYTFKMKEFEPLILPFTLITLSLGLLPKNAIISILFLRENYLLKGLWILFASTPILLWVTSKFKDVKKSEEN